MQGITTQLGGLSPHPLHNSPRPAEAALDAEPIPWARSAALSPLAAAASRCVASICFSALSSADVITSRRLSRALIVLSCDA